MNPLALQNQALMRLLRARRQALGLGFLESYDQSYNADDGYYWEDQYGNWGYEDAWGSYGGGSDGSTWDSFGNFIDAGQPAGFSSWADYIQALFTPTATITDTAEPNLPSLPSTLPTSPDGLTWGGTSDWLASWWDQITGGNPTTTGDPSLPGYCPKGTYHPVNDPFSCVPFPADPNAKKAVQQQQKQQQQANAAAKAAQKKQDATCPKGQFKNPQTGQCQPIPRCPQGTAFDSRTQKCLTPQQAKDLYGSDWSWLWWVLGGVVVVRIASDYSNSRGRK